MSRSDGPKAANHAQSLNTRREHQPDAHYRGTTDPHGYPQTSAQGGHPPHQYDGYSYPSYAPQAPRPARPAPELGHQLYGGQGYPQPSAYQAPQAGAFDPPQGGDPRYQAVLPEPPPARMPPLRPEPPAPSYAPQFDSYFPPTAPAYAEPGEHDHHNWQAAQSPAPEMRREFGHDAPDRAAYAQPSRDPRLDGLRGGQFDHWPQAEDRGYDLGHYGQPGAPAQGHGPSAYEPPMAGWAQQAPAHGEAQAYGDGYGYAELDPRDGPHDPQLHTSQGQIEAYRDPNESEADYEDEPSGTGRGRGLMIVAALIGAIGVGGGLAYGYKTFVASPAKTTPQVVKAPQQPAKTVPADPGGRKFANIDSKLMDRLPSDSAAAGSAAGSSEIDGTGARKVQIIPVGRDGSLGAPPPMAAPSLPPPTQPAAVPGLTIVDGGVRVPAAVLPPARNAPQAAPAEASAGSALSPVRTPVRPQVVARVEPVATPEPARPQVVAKAEPAAEPPRPRAAAPAEPKRATGTNGYVAVLASQKSRMDALKSFADLQQKYNSVLSNRIPDVQEADLSARGLGTMYRVVVGPPGSREAAADLCGQLKSAGYQGCWVTGY